MALDFAALQAEFYARGFGYLNDGGAGVTRAKRFLNDAMHTIDAADDWPYLFTTSTVTAGVDQLGLLAKVESVYDSTLQATLPMRSHAELVRDYGDLTVTGTPACFYVTPVAGDLTSINTFPASSHTLTVNYWRNQTDLSANGDLPNMPDRFRYAIVDRAVAMAYRDQNNDLEAQIADKAADDRVDLMRSWAQGLAPESTFVPLSGDDC